MENPIIVPFDLNTARKIKSGEIEGSVLIDNIEIEFVYESKDCAGPYNLLFVKKRWIWDKCYICQHNSKTQIRGKTGPGYIYGQWNRPKQLHSLYYCEAEFLSRLVTAKYKRYEQFCNRYSR